MKVEANPHRKIQRSGGGRAPRHGGNKEAHGRQRRKVRVLRHGRTCSEYIIIYLHENGLT